MVSTQSVERMSEGDHTMLLLSLYREMTEMNRKNKEVTKKREKELWAL